MKTINRNNTDDLNLVDKAHIKNLKKKSKYLRKMKQKNGNINLFEQSGEVKEIKFKSGASLKFFDTGESCFESYTKENNIEDLIYYEEDYV